MLEPLAEMPPSTPTKNERNPTSNNGGCIPTNGELCLDASGPGVTCTTSKEGTISNEPTKCEAVTVVEPTRTEGATATAHPTKNEDVSEQIVIMNREKGATANQELTMGESNVGAKSISSKRKEDATTENDPLRSPLGKQNFMPKS